MQELELERKKLEQTLKIIGQILIDEKIDLENLYRDFIGSRDELWAIADQRKIHIKNLETSSDKPYFARIDFIPEGDEYVVCGAGGAKASYSQSLIDEVNNILQGLRDDGTLSELSIKYFHEDITTKQ